jgi:hypothetical protein
VGRFCAEHIAPLAVDSDRFRKERMYNEDVHTIIAAELPRIKNVYAQICGPDKRVDIYEWMTLLRFTGMCDAHYTERHARFAFVTSNPIVVDEQTRSEAELQRDTHHALSLCQFIEALCRMADVKCQAPTEAERIAAEAECGPWGVGQLFEGLNTRFPKHPLTDRIEELLELLLDAFEDLDDDKVEQIRSPSILS